MTPLDTTIAYKVSLLLLFHRDFWHNSLGSTCTCHYLLVGANIYQHASPSKLQCHRHGLVIYNWDPAQVGAHPMKLENISRRYLDVLHLAQGPN